MYFQINVCLFFLQNLIGCVVKSLPSRSGGYYYHPLRNQRVGRKENMACLCTETPDTHSHASLSLRQNRVRELGLV